MWTFIYFMDFLVILFSLISRLIMLWSENIFWTTFVLWNVLRLALWAAYGQFWYMLYGLLKEYIFWICWAHNVLHTLSITSSWLIVLARSSICFLMFFFLLVTSVIERSKLKSPTMNVYLPISISCQFCTICFESCYLLGHRDWELFLPS